VVVTAALTTSGQITVWKLIQLMHRRATWLDAILPILRD
jgi:hypothetical protein